MTLTIDKLTPSAGAVAVVMFYVLQMAHTTSRDEGVEILCDIADAIEALGVSDEDYRTGFKEAADELSLRFDEEPT